MKGKRRDIFLAAAGFFLNGLAAAAAVYAAALLILCASGIRPYIVLSGSMEPEIKTGSLCFVNTKAEFDEIIVGDVIAFETAGGGLVTHRAIGIEGDRIETKGDANDVSDGFTTARGNFRGKTLFSVPYLGYFNCWMSSRQGKFLCAAMIFLVLTVKMPRKEGKNVICCNMHKKDFKC